MIDYDRLKGHVFPPVMQRCSARDCMLYALGLNLGQDPLDAGDLAHVAAMPPVPVITMPMTLGRIGAWMSDPDVGIDYRRIVVGEVELVVHAPLQAEGELVAHHRVVQITDKGEGKGALVRVARELRDRASGVLLAEYTQLTFCRADGGFARGGRHDPPPPVPEWVRPLRDPDMTRVLPTSPRQALIYRLSGDMNPLHSDPDVARAAGFQRPILHGLATMGMAGHAIETFARSSALRLGRIGARLSAPVLPGQALTLHAWRNAMEMTFEMLGPDGRAVLAMGRASLAPAFSHSRDEISHAR